MERGLLWASVVIGVMVFLARFVSPRSEASGVSANAPPNKALALVALLTPIVGFLLTLPTRGAFFHPGGLLGVGFLLGGVGVLAASVTGPRFRMDAGVLSVGYVGVAAALAALTQVFLRASLLDALLGVAIGWFCVAFALYVMLRDTESREFAHSLAAGAGAASALCAASVFGTLRDGITPEIAKGTWGGALTVFAAFGALLIAGARLLPVGGAGKWARSLPYLILLLGAGAGLYLLTQKYALDPKLAYAGMAGMLALGVGRWTLGERGRFGQGAWAISLMLITAGFMASAQALQGVGASAFTLALWLAYAAMLTENKSDSSAETRCPNAQVLLLPLFATSLLLFRLFTTRWEEDLRGAELTDSYALFGFLMGGFLPALLAGASVSRKGWAGVAALAATAALTVAVPATALLLFGAKAASALMIGLAAGRVIVSPRGGVLAALLAIGVGLALTQFFGHILPPEEWTRFEKMKALGVIVAVLLAALTTATLLTKTTGDAELKEEA